MAHVDLTDYLIRAKHLLNGWNSERFLMAKAAISKAKTDMVVEWDQGAGEGWATFKGSDSSTAYLGFDAPILVTDSALLIQLAKESMPDIVTIAVDRWDACEYTVDLEQYKNLFPKWSYVFAFNDETGQQTFPITDWIISTM